MNDYELLGVNDGADERTIKRAYAVLIKQCRPDTHPQEFARIRLAYENLLKNLRSQSYNDTETAFNTEAQTTTQPITIETVMDTPPSEEETLWLPKSSFSVAVLMAQLNSYSQPASEHKTLACFQSQLRDLDTMTIDQRMDYEEQLFWSLIYTNRPALLLFSAACEQFNWKQKPLPNEQVAQRFFALMQLSTLYQQMCVRYNPYFQIQHDAPRQHRHLFARLMPCWLTNYYHDDLAQTQRATWIAICQTANLPYLQTYFDEKSTVYPVYVIDILLGLVAIVKAYSILGEDEWTIKGTALFSSLLVVILLLIVRTSFYKRTKILVFIAGFVFLMSTLDDSVPFIISLIVIISLYRILYYCLRTLESAFVVAIEKLAQLPLFKSLRKP